MIRSMCRAAFSAAWGLSTLIGTVCASETIHSQVLSLAPGWNAVWLDVDPEEPSPDALFTGTVVDIAAGFFPTVTDVQFVADPSETPWKRPGWAVWYAPGRPESVLNTLEALDGGRPYLIHAVAAAEVVVEGGPVCRPLRWKANSLNFVGLPVDPADPPTFHEFFAGSAAHRPLRVYRLSDGRWRSVASPESLPIQRGVAYWVYCRGRSDWQGPMDVRFGGAGEIDFADMADRKSLTIVNRSVDSIVGMLMPLAGDLPICYEAIDEANLDVRFVSLTGGLDLGILESGSARTVTLQVRRERMTSAAQSAVITCRGGGCLFRIPVYAQRAIP